MEQPSSVVPLKHIYSVVSTFIVAVTVDSFNRNAWCFTVLCLFTSTPTNSKMVTTRVPRMGQLRHTKSQQNLRWILHSWDRASLMYLSITNKMQCYTIFITISALHVSGGSSAHHQEPKTVYTASGICQAFTASYHLRG